MLTKIIERFKEKLDELSEQEMIFSNSQQAYLLIRDLPDCYDSVVERICLTDPEKLSLNIAAEILIDYEVRRRERVETVCSSRALMQVNRYVNWSQPSKGQGPDSGKIEKVSSQIKCYECEGLGHIKRNCPTLKRHKYKKNFNDRSKNMNKKSQNEKINVLMNISSGIMQEETMLKIDSGNLWIYDSGATSHFCKDRELFQSFNEVNIPIRLADANCKTFAIRVGNVKIKLTDVNGKVENCILEGVYFIPSLHGNILSGLKLADRGFKTSITKDKLTIQKNGKTFAAYRRGQYFGFEAIHDIEKENVNNTETVMCTAELWHRRMGHVNYNAIKNMFKNKNVNNLEIKGKINDVVCKDCVEAKATRASCKSISRTTNKILERVHMDVWGPSKVASAGGKRYFLSIIDDFSRKVWVYALARKDEVFEKFRDFQASIERMTEEKIKAIRTDQGLEFCNNKFEKYLQEQGIKIERTSTYTPQQNGLAERFNRTILEKVRAMLFDSGLSLTHWVEALLAATHIHNRITHSNNAENTPNEKFSGNRPSIRHLRIYGSRAYLILPKQKRSSKLSPVAKLGYLVGYAIKTKGYRIWIPSENRVEESIHVRFDESINYKVDKQEKQSNNKSKRNTRIENLPDTYEDDEEVDLEEDIDRNAGPSGSNVKDENYERQDNVEKIDTQRRSSISQPLNISKKIIYRRDRTVGNNNRIYITYYPSTNPTVRLRNIYDAKKYCESNGYPFNEEDFNFETKTTLQDRNYIIENSDM